VHLRKALTPATDEREDMPPELTLSLWLTLQQSREFLIGEKLKNIKVLLDKGLDASFIIVSCTYCFSPLPAIVNRMSTVDSLSGGHAVG
jgi:hypothetical protein